MADAPKPTVVTSIAGVILAGGRSRRYGQDKAFVHLGDARLIDHVVARVAPQVARLVISANDEARFAEFGLPVVKDEISGGLGPLAGIHAALQWLAAQSAPDVWLASFSVDTPLLPLDLVARLRGAAERDGVAIAYARSDNRLHPLLALWSPSLRDDLARALNNGDYTAQRFIERHRATVVDFPYGTKDPFANINTPDDLARLEREGDG